MRLALSAAAAVLPLVLLVAPVQAQIVTDTSPQRRLRADEFAIMPWGISVGDQRVFDDMRDCGLNMAGFVSAADLDKAEAAGLKALVHDESIHIHDSASQLAADEITSRVQAAVEKTKSHPATYGYYLRDEPMPYAFAGLAAAAAALRAAAPDAMAYINLLPNYGPNPSYDDYVSTFVETVKPNVLSYDHYAMMADGSLRGGYFQNLEAMRRASQRYELPFWNIVLSNAHFEYAEPTPATLRFQAFTTLAYGARGISYFTYFTPSIGNYRLGPLDQFMNKTPVWDMLRNVNLQIHALGPVYVTLKSVNVFHHPAVPDQCLGLDSSKFVAGIEGGQFLVGEFERPDGRACALVVNTDLHKSSSLSLTFKTPGQIQMVNSYSGKTHGWVGENSWLAPGQGVLLVAPAAP